MIFSVVLDLTNRRAQMLTNPFTGKELFAFYELNMFGTPKEEAEETWELVGRNKKRTYNEMAKMINERMRSEPNFIKGEQSPERLP